MDGVILLPPQKEIKNQHGGATTHNGIITLLMSTMAH